MFLLNFLLSVGHVVGAKWLESVYYDYNKRLWDIPRVSEFGSTNWNSNIISRTFQKSQRIFMSYICKHSEYSMIHLNRQSYNWRTRGLVKRNLWPKIPEITSTINTTKCTWNIVMYTSLLVSLGNIIFYRYMYVKVIHYPLVKIF